ncbi:MAG: mechanosensitive ion channel domain-containing protein [Halobacteriales archaeon]
MAPLSGFVPATALQPGAGSETVDDIITFLQQELVLGTLIIVAGVVVGVFLGRLSHRLLDRMGVEQTVEGTSFERTVQGFGTSTISLVSAFVGLVVVGVSILFALSVANVSTTAAFWGSVAVFIPKLLVAIFVLIVGTVAGDKAALAVSERLKGVKLPEISLVPAFVKYSIFYVASLIALSQVGVATSALLVLFSAYLFGVVFLGGLAFKDLLTSAGAGVFLLLVQPYGIGDEVIIDDYEGIVQELTVFVTRIESDGTEYIVPNRKALQSGVVRKRRS